MTTLCIDELSRQWKRRWGWDSEATHVPADADCPLLAMSREARSPAQGVRVRAAVPRWLQPKQEFDDPPGIAGLHGKASSSVG